MIPGDTKSVIATLGGKQYRLIWGPLARVRFSGVHDSVRAMGGLIPLAVMLWSAIAEKPNPFPTWEHVAEVLDEESIKSGDEAIKLLFEEDSSEKKST